MDISETDCKKWKVFICFKKTKEYKTLVKCFSNIEIPFQMVFLKQSEETKHCKLGTKMEKT